MTDAEQTALPEAWKPALALASAWFGAARLAQQAGRKERAERFRDRGEAIFERLEGLVEAGKMPERSDPPVANEEGQLLLPIPRAIEVERLERLDRA